MPGTSLKILDVIEDRWSMWKLLFNSILEEHEHAPLQKSAKREKSSSLVHRQASPREKPAMEEGKKDQGLKYVGGVQVGKELRYSRT